MWPDIYLFVGIVDFWGFFPYRIAAAPLQGALVMGVPPARGLPAPILWCQANFSRERFSCGFFPVAGR